MGFKDLKKQSSLGSLTNRLVKEVEKMNNAGGGNVDDRLSGNQRLIRVAMDMLLSDFYQHQMEKNFHG